MAPYMYKQCETQIQEMCDGESGRDKTAEEGERREGRAAVGGGGGVIITASLTRHAAGKAGCACAAADHRAEDVSVAEAEVPVQQGKQQGVQQPRK